MDAARGGSATNLTLKLTVDSPYKLVPFGVTNRGVTGNTCTNPPTGTDGYQSLVFYQIVSFLGVRITNIGVNEIFASTSADYIGNSWPPYVAGGFISNNGLFADNICAINDVTPQSLPPQSPLGTTMIDHGSQAWFIGSTNSGSGVEVQSNILQRYQDHGLHLPPITSPVR